MIVDYQSLKNFDLGRLTACQQAWITTIAQNFGTDESDFQQQVVVPVNDGSWTGSAADSGRQGVQRSQAKLSATREYLNSLIIALDGAVTGISAAQEVCAEADSIAQAAGLSFADDGTLTVQGGPADWVDPPIVAAMTAQLTLYKALFMAYKVDTRVCPILNEATKFGANDAGSWQQDATTDAQNATDTMRELPAELKGIDTAEPALPPDTPAQPYDDQSVGTDDYELWVLCTTGGLPYFYGHAWNNAGDLFKHWLGDSGMSYCVDPAQMMIDMPTFGATVDAVFITAGDGVYDTGWVNYSPGDAVESEDWYYALNDFRYRVIGVMMTDDQGEQHIRSTVGVKKPYVFGPPRKDISTPAGTLPQSALEHLHRTGQAQNYIVQGITHNSN